MNIYIRIEVLAREMQGRLLLALVAAERGHEVLIGKHNARRVLGDEASSGYPPGIFHDKSLGVNDPKSEVKRRLYKRGWGLTAQDEEHGLSQTSFGGLGMAERFPDDAFNRNHLLFAWGEHDLKAIQQLLPNEKSRIVLTGSPRVDFWRPEMLAVHSEEDILPTTGGMPFVLFSPAGLAPRDSRGEADEHKRLLRGQREVEAAKRLAQSNPELLVVVRPHPSSFLSEWEVAFRGSPDNLVVVRDQRASIWVRHAEAVISNGSTLAMECCAMGVPHINFAPDGDFEFGTVELGFTHQVGPAATSIPALQRAVSDARSPALREIWFSEKVMSGLRARFGSLSGRLAADCIVDAWEDLAERIQLNASPRITSQLDTVFPEHEPRELDLTGSGSGGSSRGLRRQLVRGMARLRGSRNERPEKAPYLEKFPPFDTMAIKKLTGQLTVATGRFANVRMRLVHNRMLLLTRN